MPKEQTLILAHLDFTEILNHIRIPSVLFKTR